MSWKDQFKRLVPAPLFLAARKLKYFGRARYCPLCGNHSSHFVGLLVNGTFQPDVVCPWCEGHDRERMMSFYLKDRTDLFTGTPGRTMLHVAPEPTLRRIFKEAIGAGYVAADRFNPNVDVPMDITQIQYPDNSFDIVYCSHVLHYIREDEKALRELCRVLKPGGWAIILAPVHSEQTHIDTTAREVGEEEVLRYSGQIWRYGRDFAQRLLDAGFTVTCIHPEEFLVEADRTKLGLRNSTLGDIYLCTKKT